MPAPPLSLRIHRFAQYPLFVLILFCRALPRRTPPTFQHFAASIPLGSAGERIPLRPRFMWNIRLVIRQNLNVYRGFCSFMNIYTLRHCMFFAHAFAFSVPAILSPLSLRG